MAQESATMDQIVPRRVYALDIETSTDPIVGPDSATGVADYNPGLDPLLGSVTEAVVKTGSDTMDAVLAGEEIDLLTGLSRYLGLLEAGLIVTWNGGQFDLPFLATRAVANGLDVGLALRHRDDLSPKYNAIPGHGPEVPGIDGMLGHTGVYDATFVAANGLMHDHLDVSHLYRGFADKHGIKWGLKPVCRALGIEMIEVDRQQMHLLSVSERRAYVLSDGVGTRLLALNALGLTDLGTGPLVAP